MDNNSVIILGIVLIAFVIIYIADVFKYRSLASALRPVVGELLTQADEILAPLGEQLKPAHDLFAAVKTLVDEDTDVIAQALDRESLVILRNLFDTALMLSDGKAPEEAKPQGE